MKNYYSPSLAQIIGTPPAFTHTKQTRFINASAERRARRKLVKAIGIRQVKRATYLMRAQLETNNGSR
jgi:hypothetical protein